MKRIAIFPGSFDPMTTGHLALLRRALPLFDQIVIAIGLNTAKQCTFPLDERLARIRQAVSQMPQVEVCTYQGLTIDLCHRYGAQFILRGVRNLSDFEYERTVADNNRLLDPDIQTVILLADPEHAVISSSLVRELHAFGHDISPYLA
ncbi:MAG: pantetheine-phosphate adenylyltransferase [Bacteroidales bacterium]|nr:pantetheine-phosphate adenylyltransferase [Bacteroidales bacterium]